MCKCWNSSKVRKVMAFKSGLPCCFKMVAVHNGQLLAPLLIVAVGVARVNFKKVIISDDNCKVGMT